MPPGTDLTSAFDFSPASGAGPLPPSAPELVRLSALVEGTVELLRDTLDRGSPFSVPLNRMPAQETLPLRGTPSGLRRLPTSYIPNPYIPDGSISW